MRKMERAILAAQVERLLLTHPHVGAEAQPLVDILDSCEYRTFEEGAVICREGDAGEEMYVLLRGRVQILIKDRGGADRELLELYAPALLGHMSLIDHSPRSATCIAGATLYMGVITQQNYRELLNDDGAQGTALRRLLLSSLNRQMILGLKKLDEMLQPAEDDGDISDRQLLKLAGALNGWEFQTEGIDDVTFTEDYDTKRARTDARRKR